MFRQALMAAALMLCAVAATAQTAPSAPDLDALLRANTDGLSIDGGDLAGPGAAFLSRATADSQFVLVGESHFDHDTPLFADGLFHMLQRDHDFHHYVVEQDGVGMDDIQKPGVRGDAKAIGALARRYPTLIGFASDQIFLTIETHSSLYP